MPVESSADYQNELQPAFDLTIGARLAMVALGYIPFLHVCSTIAATTLAARYGGVWPAIATAVLVVYLVPPLAARLVRPRSTLTAERYVVGTLDFFRWWYTAQCQVLFNRLPSLEEILRLVPGLYSPWMRLWGARIGSLVYWSPRVVIYDRCFLDIGDRVVIGANTRICPHFLARRATGEMELVLATVSIGHDALVGGFSLLPAGVQIGPCEQTPGYLPMAPFALFQNGRHIRTKRFQKEGSDD